MNQTQKQPLEKPQTQIIAVEKTLADNVQNRITQFTNEGRLNLPANYSVGNALNSAWLILQSTKDKNGSQALQVCTKPSIANALLDMAIMGLNPAKKQGYFIAYGDQLTWFTSYFGKCAVVKRLKGIDNEPIATLIYKGDKITIGHNELGEETVVDHETLWESKLSGEIVGVYATVKQGNVYRSAVMTKAEVKEAWLKNPGQKRDHVDFEGEFMKRTAINRLTKMIIQTSNDDDLLAETFIQNEEKHYDFDSAKEVETSVIQEIEQKANAGEVVDIAEDPTPKKEEPVVLHGKVTIEPESKQQSLFDSPGKPTSRGF